jgi:hypothetical protein
MVFAALFGGCWLLGQHDDDVGEELWLRSVLAGLSAPMDADEPGSTDDDLYIA